MELGRECLASWGYKRCDDVIWVKTNQLQRIIRTGRTGHWLNHGKEHCLVGFKGNPKDIRRGLDCDSLWQKFVQLAINQMKFTESSSVYHLEQEK